MKDDSPHQLEAFLQAQMSEGRRSSEGSFTLHKEKALQKIAEFQSPYPQGWTLNLAQAAVLYESAQLQIYLTSKETQFRFRPERWEGGQDFESLFFNPVTLEDRALQVLRSALWSVGVGQKHPFQISFPGEKKTHIWDGLELRTLGTERSTEQIHVTVSQRSLSQGGGLPIIRSIQSAFYNSTLGELLQSALYCMPIPVYLDSLRLDGFACSPTHGLKAHSYPLRLFGFQTSQPPLASPRRGHDTNQQHVKLRELSRGFLEQEPKMGNWSIATLLSATGGYYSGSKSGTWRTEPTQCNLCWVRYGVIVQRELVDLSRLGVSVAIHLSADHIETDFSGFSLREDAAAPIRGEALQLVAAYLVGEEVSFQVTSRVWFNRKKALAGAAVVGGLALGVLMPPLGGFVTVLGIGGGLNLLNTPDALCDNFDKDYQKLREAWARKFLHAGDNELGQ